MLCSNTTGSYNTGSGFEALYSNTSAIYNTATGALALLTNTTGIQNTASGAFALQQNTTGNYNTARSARIALPRENAYRATCRQPLTKFRNRPINSEKP